MKHFLLVSICLLGLLTFTTAWSQNLAEPDKPEITSINPIEDSI